jgi:hypothetical protein
LKGVRGMFLKARYIPPAPFQGGVMEGLLNIKMVTI